MAGGHNTDLLYRSLRSIKMVIRCAVARMGLSAVAERFARAPPVDQGGRGRLGTSLYLGLLHERARHAWGCKAELPL
eukprot:15192324-Alexandrium_andersonii.AAC.1